MRRLSRVEIQRATFYLGGAVLGLSIFVGAYCMISGRPVGEVLGNWWIALLIACGVVVGAALRDQREERQGPPATDPSGN